MKYSFFLLLTLFAFIGCGQKAKGLKAPHKEIQNWGGVSFLKSFGTVDETMRTASIVLYPNPQELKGVSYTPNEDLWQMVMENLPYGHIVPFGFAQDEISDLKNGAVVHIVLSISDARDRFYLVAQKGEQELEQKEKEIDELVSKTTQAYPCYYLQEGEGQKSCQKKAHEGDSEAHAFIAKSCKELGTLKYDFTPEEQAHFQEEVDFCNQSFNQYRSYRRDVKKEVIGKNMELRDMAKGIVTDMLRQLEVKTKQRYLFTASSKEDPTPDDIKSTIELEGQGLDRKVKNLALYLDDGNGPKMYSTQNGKIKDVVYLYHERPSSLDFFSLDFTLTGDDFTIKAHLSEDSRGFFDLRYIGDITYYQGDIVRKGVMKLEWSFL